MARDASAEAGAAPLTGVSEESDRVWRAADGSIFTEIWVRGDFLLKCAT